ncbi:MAG: copper amine oxidase N-terminal domain-containing protein [Oscillospiraceae bacterium]|nr:copper amine oxidase N-terminal domain-containing protein [Oscillospiraceae bacterium]
MKKIAAIVLSTALLAGVFPAVGAAEEPADTSTENLYAQYGPYRDWTQEQRDAAEADWTYEQWDEYWSAYSAYAWSYYLDYYDDYDSWYSATHASATTDVGVGYGYGSGSGTGYVSVSGTGSGSVSDYDYVSSDGDSYTYVDAETNDYGYYDDYYSEWDSYLADEKAELGMPYPYGANVKLNGEYLNFGDAAPFEQDDEIMVPARAFFEQLGATVSYDSGSIRAVYANGDAFSFTIGDTQLLYTKDGSTKAVTMATAPVLVSGTTYLPVSAVAEALGYTPRRSWYYNLISLSDLVSLRKEINADFTHMNALLAAFPTLDPAQTYATDSTITYAATLYGEEENDTATYTINSSILSCGNSYSMDSTTNFDWGDMQDTLATIMPDEVQEVLDLLSGQTNSIIYNSESDTAYIEGSVYSDLLETPADSWYAIEGLGIETSELTTPTVADIAIAMTSLSYDTDCYSGAQKYASLLSMVLGDSVLKESTKNGVTTYTTDTDLVSVLTSAYQNGLLTSDNIRSVLLGSSNLPSMKFNLEATVEDGAITSLTSSGNVDLSSLINTDNYYYSYYSYSSLSFLSMPQLIFDCSYTPGEMNCHIALRGEYVGRLDLTCNNTITTSTETVPTAPPEGAEIIVD